VYAAVIGAAAAAGEPARALALLRAAQLAGLLRHVDASLASGTHTTGGLPASALAAVVPDALCALRAAVRAGAVPPPPSLRIFHAPEHRPVLRALLAGALSPPLSSASSGRRAARRSLDARGGDWLAFLTGEGEAGEGAGAAQRVAAPPARLLLTSGHSEGQGQRRGGAAASAPRAHATLVAAALASARPLGGLSQRSIAYAPLALRVLAFSAVPPASQHLHPLTIDAKAPRAAPVVPPPPRARADRPQKQNDGGQGEAAGDAEWRRAWSAARGV
jgi:hypothetical protein